MTNTKTIILSLFAALGAIPAHAQVKVPFEVKAPGWEFMATARSDNDGPKLNQRPSGASPCIMCIPGPEWDTYEWSDQVNLNGDFYDEPYVLKLNSNSYCPVIQQKGGWTEVEFSNSMNGWAQDYTLKKATVIPITESLLMAQEHIAVWRGSDNELYAVVDCGTEMNFGWSATFEVGKLRGGYLMCPYSADIEIEDTSFKTIRNGKLSREYEFTSFTMEDVKQILQQAKPLESCYNVYFGVPAEDGTTFLQCISTGHLRDGSPVYGTKVYDASELETPVSYPGGTAAIYRHLASVLRYPALAMENGQQGTVKVRFTVNTDGSLSDLTVVQSVTPEIDREALRCVKTLRGFTSGKIGGKPVKSSFVLPIKFKL